MSDPDVLAPQQPNPAYPPGPVQDVVRALLSNAGNEAYNTLSIPKRFMQASEELRQGGDYDPAPAVDTMRTLLGAGVPAAEEGAAGIFGGRLAQGIDNNALKMAQWHEALGKGPPQIWKTTGWFRGPDDKWRFEINDSKAMLRPPILDYLDNGKYRQGWAGEGKLGEVLSHPDLYRAYPDLKDVSVRFDPRASSLGSHGPYPGREYISVNPSEAGNQGPVNSGVLRTLLHEAQHGVQWREGFTPGANYDHMQEIATTALGNVLAKKPLYKEQLTPREISNIKEAAGAQAYMKHAGEAEARNVTDRWDYRNHPMKDILSYPSYPPFTADYPPNQMHIAKPFPNSPYQQMLDALGR